MILFHCQSLLICSSCNKSFFAVSISSSLITSIKDFIPFRNVNSCGELSPSAIHYNVGKFVHMFVIYSFDHLFFL